MLETKSAPETSVSAKVLHKKLAKVDEMLVELAKGSKKYEKVLKKRHEYVHKLEVLEKQTQYHHHSEEMDEKLVSLSPPMEDNGTHQESLYEGGGEEEVYDEEDFEQSSDDEIDHVSQLFEIVDLDSDKESHDGDSRSEETTSERSKNSNNSDIVEQETQDDSGTLNCSSTHTAFTVGVDMVSNDQDEDKDRRLDILHRKVAKAEQMIMDLMVDKGDSAKEAKLYKKLTKKRQQYLDELYALEEDESSSTSDEENGAPVVTQDEYENDEGLAQQGDARYSVNSREKNQDVSEPNESVDKDSGTEDSGHIVSDVGRTRSSAKNQDDSDSQTSHEEHGSASSTRSGSGDDSFEVASNEGTDESEPSPHDSDENGSSGDASSPHTDDAIRLIAAEAESSVQVPTKVQEATNGTEQRKQKESSREFLDRRSLPEPYSENTKKILRELETIEGRHKKLEKSLVQNGIPVSEDIPYEVAKDKISEITDSMRELASADMDPYAMETKYNFLEEQLAKYSTALMLTDEYAEEQKRIEDDWEDSIESDNLAALQKIWSHMPVNVKSMTEDELSSAASPNGKTLPKPFARKFKRTNVLQLLRVNPDDIEKMHPSLLDGLRTTGLTLTERRAIHEHLRDTGDRWQNKMQDPSCGKKYQWFQNLKLKFKEMLNAYTTHVEKYGPPGNHPFANRNDPNGGGCAMLGNQCPLKADAVIDYSEDYGYPQET
ncbi:MAG: hypothetical protein SGILL_006684, partial [Bacillariaceae sp.]